MSDEKLPAKMEEFMEMDLDTPNSLAVIFTRSGYFSDVRTASQAAVKIMAGRELGLGAFASMQNIDIVEGHLRLRSNILAALVKASKRYDYRVKTSTDTECEIEFYEWVDGTREPLGTSSFTDKDRERAGLSLKTRSGASSVWAKYPRNMLFARALSNGVNMFCPDAVSAGRVYTEGDFPDEAPSFPLMAETTSVDVLNASLEEE